MAFQGAAVRPRAKGDGGERFGVLVMTGGPVVYRVTLIVFEASDSFSVSLPAGGGEVNRRGWGHPLDETIDGEKLIAQHNLNFAGKVVFIYKANRENDVALENPRIEIHNGRTFLVGIIPDGGSANDWMSGLTAYVAWDQIEELVIFDSIEDYFSRLSQSWIDQQLQ